MLKENHWLLELSQTHGIIKGIVGWVDLCSPEVAVQLERYTEQTKIKGIKHVVIDEPDDNFTPVIGFLFVIIITWEALCMVLMWRALKLFKSVRDPRGLLAVDIAFIAGLLLFIGFMIADEILIAYLIEGTHMHIFLTLLVSMLVFHLLPDGRRTRSLQSDT